MLKGLYILNEDSFNKIYAIEEQKGISELIDIYSPLKTVEDIKENPKVLEKAEVIFSGWGGPKIDEEFLKYAPNLKIVFYGAGSIKGIVSKAFWEQGIRITSAYAANAVPVVEFTLAEIILSLKRTWYLVQKMKREKTVTYNEEVPGAYQSTVGLVSLGMIGKGVAKRLQDFDLELIAYDPFASKEDAKKLGVELCSLEELFQKSDVVSLHTPSLKETEGMIKKEHFAMMKKDSTFINTARGAVVNESEMIEVLQERPDIYALLDVTHPEPPANDSPLYTLENVVLTPHIAGSLAGECRRMGRYMLEELERYLAGKELKWEISKEKAKIMA
ncbi:hydroxyacid dehydrogenase [Natronospora cellulosivora (SeqCode)]